MDLCEDRSYDCYGEQYRAIVGKLTSFLNHATLHPMCGKSPG